jgi:hypothetical protein
MAWPKLHPLTQDVNTYCNCFYIFKYMSYEYNSTRFRVARLQRFQIYINDLGFSCRYGSKKNRFSLDF